jgi:hypothetical protein
MITSEFSNSQPSDDSCLTSTVSPKEDSSRNSTMPSQRLPEMSKVFQPLKVGNIVLSHRILMAPLSRYRNTDDHVPLEMAVEYYSDRAAVPGTLIISEATAISRNDETDPNDPGI